MFRLSASTIEVFILFLETLALHTVIDLHVVPWLNIESPSFGVSLLLVLVVSIFTSDITKLRSPEDYYNSTMNSILIAVITIGAALIIHFIS